MMKAEKSVPGEPGKEKRFLSLCNLVIQFYGILYIFTYYIGL